MRSDDRDSTGCEAWCAKSR